MATLCSTADANVCTSATTILSVVLWAQVALSPSRAARDQRSTFDVVTYSLPQRACARSRPTANRTPPARYLDKVGRSDTIDDRLLTISWVTRKKACRSRSLRLREMSYQSKVGLCSIGGERQSAKIRSCCSSLVDTSSRIGDVALLISEY